MASRLYLPLPLSLARFSQTGRRDNFRGWGTRFGKKPRGSTAPLVLLVRFTVKTRGVSSQTGQGANSRGGGKFRQKGGKGQRLGEGGKRHEGVRGRTNLSAARFPSNSSTFCCAINRPIRSRSREASAARCAASS